MEQNYQVIHNVNQDEEDEPDFEYDCFEEQKINEAIKDVHDCIPSSFDLDQSSPEDSKIAIKNADNEFCNVF